MMKFLALLFGLFLSQYSFAGPKSDKHKAKHSPKTVAAKKARKAKKEHRKLLAKKHSKKKKAEIKKPEFSEPAEQIAPPPTDEPSDVTADQNNSMPAYEGNPDEGSAPTDPE